MLYSFCVYTVYAYLQLSSLTSTGVHHSLRTVFIPWLFSKASAMAIHEILSAQHRCQNLGYFLQKHRHLNEPKLFASCYLILSVRDSKRRIYWHTWHTCFLIFLVSVGFHNAIPELPKFPPSKNFRQLLKSTKTMEATAAPKIPQIVTQWHHFCFKTIYTSLIGLCT